MEVDHAIGSKVLIIELAELGYSISYDEIKRFKLSIMMGKDADAVKHLVIVIRCGCYTIFEKPVWFEFVFLSKKCACGGCHGIGCNNENDVAEVEPDEEDDNLAVDDGNIFDLLF